MGHAGRVRGRRPNHEPQIVTLQLATDVLLGVMVDELSEIPEIQHEHIEKISGILAGESMLTEGLVKPDELQNRLKMIVLVSPNRLRRRFMAAQHAA